MALYTYQHDAEKVTEAGRRWVRTCLVGDESVFGDGLLATLDNFDITGVRVDFPDSLPCCLL